MHCLLGRQLVHGCGLALGADFGLHRRHSWPHGLLLVANLLLDEVLILRGLRGHRARWTYLWAILREDLGTPLLWRLVLRLALLGRLRLLLLLLRLLGLGLVRSLCNVALQC